MVELRKDYDDVMVMVESLDLEGRMDKLNCHDVESQIFHRMWNEFVEL